MKHYEETLDKVSPVFYKSLQYMDYFDESGPSLYSYLHHEGVSGAYYLDFSIKNVYYIYIIEHAGYSDPFKGKIVSDRQMMLTKRDKNTRYLVSPVELIIDMIINNFRFENEFLDVKFSFSRNNMNCKNIFIALVGNDLYETLRASIR